MKKEMILDEETGKKRRNQLGALDTVLREQEIEDKKYYG